MNKKPGNPMDKRNGPKFTDTSWHQQRPKWRQDQVDALNAPAHTPGPWEFRRDAVPEWHEQYSVYSEESNKYHQTIATVMISEANAHLIAAAPDLLAALEAVRTWMISPAIDPDTIASIRATLDEALNKARGDA